MRFDDVAGNICQALSGGSSACPFLTASDSPSGRWRYYNEDKHRWDTLRFPNASYLTLPTTCPIPRYRTCALVGNSGAMLPHKLGRACQVLARRVIEPRFEPSLLELTVIL